MMRLLRGVLANIVLLSIATASAVAIWVVAKQEADPIETRQFTIPINVENAPNLSLITQLEDEVTLVVEGRRNILTPLNARHFFAFVDVSSLGFNTATLPIDVSLQFNNEQDAELDREIQIGEDLQVVLKNPPEIEVTVEEIITRKIPIRIDPRGSVATGYRLGVPLPEPEEITVTGSASRVSGLEEVRITIFLDNARETQTFSLRPVFYSANGSVATTAGLTVDTDFVQVTVPIEQLEGVANKPITAQWSGEVAEGYRLLNVLVEPSNVLVAGLPASLDSLRILNTEIIDVTGLNETDTFPTGLILPEGVSLVESQQFFVTVEVEPILTTALEERSVEVRALAEGLTATLSVDTVRVFLFGPSDTLDSLEQEDVRVTLDLLNLGVGEHNLEPTVAVSVNDVEIRSVQPAVITVQINDTTPPEDDPLNR